LGKLIAGTAKGRGAQKVLQPTLVIAVLVEVFDGTPPAVVDSLSLVVVAHHNDR